MKHILNICLFLFTIISIVSCDNTVAKVTINGKLKNAMEVPVWLGHLNVDDIVPIDSSTTDKSGSFSIQTDIEEPSLYVLKIGPKSIYLVLRPHEILNVEIDNSIDSSPYYVEGSTDSRLVQEIITKQERVLNEITDISIEYENSKMNPDNFLEKKAELDIQYDQLLQKHKKYTTETIYSNPESLACIFALYQNFGKKNQALFDKFEDFSVFNFIDSTLSLKYPNTPAVQALNRDVTDIRAQMKYKKFAEKLTEPGRKAPNFEIESIENKKITLSDFSEKPVVYIFFATWNKSAVQEVKEMNDIYKRFRYLGLKVVGVSFDSSKEHLNTFIEENDIQFPVACDYLYWNSKYVEQFGIRKIPDLILINPEHIIEKRTINTTELNQILIEWRKSNLL